MESWNSGIISNNSSSSSSNVQLLSAQRHPELSQKQKQKTPADLNVHHMQSVTMNQKRSEAYRTECRLVAVQRGTKNQEPCIAAKHIQGIKQRQLFKVEGRLTLQFLSMAKQRTTCCSRPPSLISRWYIFPAQAEPLMAN